MAVKKQLLLFLGSIAFLFIAIFFIFPRFSEDTNDNFSDEPVVKEDGGFDSTGSKSGLWKGYYKNGNEAYHGNYQSGLKEGAWNYFTKDGKLFKHLTYNNGLKNGKVSIFSDGRLYDEISYTNGKKNGKHIHYSATGSVNYVQEYKNDSMSGEFIIYSATGKITQKGSLSDGKNVGEWRMYNDQGSLTEVNVFDTLTSTYREIKFSLNGDTLSDKIVKQ